jgi:lysophospholipase
MTTDLLIDIPENPIPERATAGMFETRDRTKIRYARFAPAGRPHKGTVIILHGRNESIEKYFETVRDFSKRGLGVATFDWRGQGGSDRITRDPSRGHIGDFHTYVSDLEQFIADIVLPDCRSPYYILGHSTGSLVALLATPRLINRIRRMVLCAPLLAFARTPFSIRSIIYLTGFLRLFGLGRMYMAGGPRPDERKPFATNVLTTDRDRYMRNAAIVEKAPELALGGPTVAWVNSAMRAARTVRDRTFMANIKIPVLIVSAAADQVVSATATEEYAARLRSGALISIDGAQHEILQESDTYREQFLAAFDAFVPGTDPTP